MFDETWLNAGGQPENQTTSSATQFYAGETVYQGSSTSTATASGVIIANTGNSATFKVKSITGTFTADTVVWAQTVFQTGHAGYAESNQIRQVTLVSTTNAVVEQATMSFLLGTLDSTLGENVIDCGTIT